MPQNPKINPRELVIGNMIRRLVEWQSWQLLSHEAYKANIDTAAFLKNEDQKKGYLMCLDDTIEMLKGFPLQVEHVNGSGVVTVTVDGQNVSKGPLQ